ncbi:MAG: sulfotransferase domain-containing protein, partial [Chitinophagaceae bacterium]|nr:sulfotransferase domain-containing protein [Chitinophagaceae bacterium]
AILRNPVDRAYSHWKMNRKQGIDALSFEDAIAQESERAKERLPYQDLVYSYTDRGFYSEQIRRYQRYFKDHHLLFVMYDDLKNKPTETLEKISAFLSVPPLHIPFEQVHASEFHEPMKESTRQQLQGLYHYDIREVERLLGWNCAHWLS